MVQLINYSKQMKVQIEYYNHIKNKYILLFILLSGKALKYQKIIDKKFQVKSRNFLFNV